MEVRLKTCGGFLLKLFGLAWVLSFIWELAQKPLYIVGTFPPFPGGWLRATTWDAGYITLLYIFFALIHRDFFWLERKNVLDTILIILIGFGTAIFVERQALALGKWFYAPGMPIVPFLGVGLTPFIQLPLMSFLVYWIARKKFE